MLARRSVFSVRAFVRRSVFAGLLLSVALGWLTPPAAQAVPSLTDGADVNISRAAGNQAEATIAINPANTQQMFKASNPGITAANSTDGGQTWNTFNITGLGLQNICCDNVAVFDNFGNLFLVTLTFGADNTTANRNNDNTIELLTSTTGGNTGSFTVLQQIDVGRVDQPSVAVGGNSVWVTWNDGGTIRARGAAVTGLGTVGAFTAEQDATNSNAVRGQFGDVAVGPGGQVVVTYQSTTTCADGNGNNFAGDPGECEGPGNIFVNTDADGTGAGGFGAQVNVGATNVGKFDYIPAQNGRSIDAEANLAYDQSTGPNAGRLYLSYTDEATDEGNDTNIFVRTSNDNGANWSAPTQVNDTNANSQFLPELAVDPTTGVVGVTWHDARRDTNAGDATDVDTNNVANDEAQFWGTASDNGGGVFAADIQISAGTSRAATAGSGVDFGDYTGSSFHCGDLFPVWADNSNSTGDNPAGANSTFDIYTSRVAVGAQPALSITDVSQNEGLAGTTAFNFTVSLSAASNCETIRVNYQTANGTATTGDGDYQSTSGTLTFAPGDASETATVNVIGDNKFEPNETFFVNLSGAVRATIADGQGQGTIVNDDDPPKISINDVAADEGDAGTTPLVFTVSLSNPSYQAVTVDYQTNDGSATLADNDYQSASGTVVFLAEDTSETVTINVNGDNKYEAGDQFTVDLSNPTNSTILDGQGVGTIQNDDPIPAASIDDVSVAEGHAGETAFVFTVALTNPSYQTITFDYATADATATLADADYQAGSGTVTFLEDDTSETLTILVNADVTIEPNETFLVNLLNPVNGTIADGQGVGTIENDDLDPNAACTITGTNKDDVLFGTPGDDVICGLNGDDQIYGLGGNDVLKGDNGQDVLRGGLGHDLLLGGTAHNDLDGGSGNDHLRGDNGANVLVGGIGSDALFGGEGPDALDTRDGVSRNDLADGGGAPDVCQTDPGDFTTEC